MGASQIGTEKMQLSVENIGGIDSTTVEFTPGVTALAGRNATNRTSLLQAIMAAFGSDRVSLKGDATEGAVEMTIGDETYNRTLERHNGTIITGGNPYLDDTELADLFAFLLESNEARQAVARSEDLRELIMRPVDTEAIQAEIKQLEAEQREIETELSDLDTLADQLVELEDRRTTLTQQISEKQNALEVKEEELAEADADVEDSRADKRELEAALDELHDARASLDDTRFELSTQRESLEALQEERSELQTQLDELPGTPVGDIEEIETEIGRLRDRLRSIDSTVNELQTIIQFNEEMLDGTSREIVDSLRGERDTEAETLTDQLVSDTENVVCWTCGSEVPKSEIEETLDQLQQFRSERFEERNSLRAEIDQLQEEKNTLEEHQRERDRLERRTEQIDSELERRETRIEELQSERDELESEIEQLEDDVEDLQEEDYSEILDLHKEANQLEFELGRIQNQRESVESEIDDIETRVEQRDELKQRQETVQDELADLRTRIQQIEKQAIEQFNDHMETVLDLLEYANLERIWIERTEHEVTRGRRTVSERTFDLHVIRSTDSGTAYEDTVDHLSESEREVTGLVFALAGYLVHEVHESVPIMLLDSLEAIDSDRIAALIEYVADYAGFLVVALLPEDAAAVDEEYQRVTEI
ncbi:archaea-specific SMC-related protein [Halocatena pleomorpha]|uniref:Chromosome segregation protein SMC n=1 Tax=Halocatena pleomorpha TaxID=1785090 RepID=A0A3P3RCQ0_9EURY|nr:archaea-specific SMC-related protein [Halocatena pleomorpha]RRJ30718.1 chromosome segregation protein SMC [Halocatena pleomorpha]